MSDFLNNLGKIGMVMQAGGGSLAGRDGMGVVREWQQQQDDVKKREAIAGLLAQSGIGGLQRGLLEQLPVDQQPSAILNFIQQQDAQRRAGGAAGAAQVRAAQEQAAYSDFMAQFQGGQQQPQSPYSTGVAADFIAPSQPLSMGQPSAMPTAMPAPPVAAPGGLSFGQASTPAPVQEAAPTDAFTGARATYERLLRMPPPPPGTGARKAYDDALEFYERQVEFFAPPQVDPSSAEARIARIKSLGYSFDQAVSVVDGINEITPTGELMNTITGDIVGAPPPTGATVDPNGTVGLSFPPTVPTDVNYSDAFGATGAAVQGANIIADAVGLNIPGPQIQRAQTALSNLALQTVTTLQENFPGRPSVDLMRKLEEVAARPAQVLRGDQRSTDIMEQTSAMIEDFIRQEQRKIENPRGYTMAQRSKARENIDSLGPLLSNYRAILSRLKPAEGGTSTGVQWRIVE